jgi:hypothetical protein
MKHERDETWLETILGVCAWALIMLAIWCLS